MQSVGQKLRHAREAQGHTLEELHSSTRIPIKALEAIEADDLNGVSSAFLYRSFVRQMAEYLAIDYNAELNAFVHSATDRIPPPLMPGQGTHAAPRLAALQMGKRRNTRWAYSLSLFAMALVACSGVYAFWQNDKLGLPVVWHKIAGTAQVSPSTSHVAAPPLGIPPSKAHPERSPQPEVPTTIASNDPVVESRVSAPATTRLGSFTLELSATEPAWLSIVADGRVSFKGILERAQTKILEGHRTARIRTGNAGAVEVVFNGKSLGALGSRGQVRTVLFTKNDYEILRAPARVSFFRFSQNGELAQSLPVLDLIPGL